MDIRKPLLVMLNICPYRRGKAKSSYATRRVPTFSGDKFYIVSNNLEGKYEIRQTVMEESRHMAR